MSKGIYKEWLKPEKLILLHGWKINGLTDIEIAKNIGISETTIYEWKKSYPEFEKALKIGKQQANFLIENKLFEKARSGNTAAIIFWLKNNWHAKYSDSRLTQEERNNIIMQTAKLKEENIQQALDSDLKKAKLENVTLANKKIRESFGNSDTEQAITNFLHKLDDSIEDSDGNK